MARGRTQSRSDVDTLIQETEEVTQEATSRSIEDRLQDIELTMKLLLLHAQFVTKEIFTEDDLE